MELESDDRAKRGTSRAERLAMLEFLRIPDNFALMTGQASKGKSMKGGQRITKAHGHAQMADYVNMVVRDSTRTWTTKDAKFRASLVRPNNSGRDLTQKDYKRKIFTIESKLESICPYYNDMNALFGERQNFRSSFVLETNNDI
ncbi:hypothetical protein H310_15244, partial [Aphanomyces invadans]